MKSNQVVRYKIAEVTVEIKPDGKIMYRVYCAGTLPEQGGMVFTYGNFGTPNLEQSLDEMKLILVQILKRIAGRENEEK